MGTLRLFAALALLAGGTVANADPMSRWRPIIAEASVRFGVPAAWIERVMRAESAGLTHLNGRPIRSSAGAMGLMQLMPATWTTMRQRLGLGGDPDDPRDNILAGTFYLRLMHDRFGYPGLFGAYNLGPTGYARYLAGKRALPSETIFYLAKLTGRPPAAAEQVPMSPPPSLFIVQNSAPAPAGEAIGAGLFAVRRDAR